VNLLYLIISVFYALGCCFIGLFLLSLLLKLDKADLSIDWYAIIASGFLLGQATLANVWLLMGVAGIFSPGLICATFLGTSGISFFLFLRKKRIELFQPVMASIVRFRTLSWYWQGLGLLIAVILLNFGVMAVTSPPIGDAAAFYMVLPKIIAASHRLVPQPNYYAFSQIGLSGEMHYAALMSIASPQAAKLFVWFTTLALAVILIALNTVVGNSRIGKIVSLALFFTSTTVTYYIFDGKVEIFGGAFGLAAYYWALRTENVPGRAPYILAGLFTGFAIIAKLTSIPVLVPGIVILIVWNNFTRQVAQKERYVDTVKCLCIVGLIAACTMIPHFIKNYTLFGEPFAPLLFLKTGGKLLAEQAYFSYEATKHIIMTYPIALVYGMYPMQGGNLSVLVLAFAPLFFLFPEHNKIAAQRFRQVAVIALLGVILWVFVRPSWIMPRYILATLLLFIPLAANGVEKLFSNQAKYFNFLRGTVFLSILIVVCTVIPYNRTSFKQFARHIVSKTSDYSPSNSSDSAFELVNRMILPGERVFFAGYYGYFFSPEVLQCSNGPNEHTDIILMKASTAPLDWVYLYDRGFKYLLLDKRTHVQMAGALQIGTAPPWLSVTKILDDESASIYKISSIDSGKKPSYVCKQIQPPAWDVVKTSDLKKF
jgi:hypothetical protein